MPTRILHAATRAAYAAAASQQEQCEAVIAPWAGGNVTVRALGSGGALRQTLTLGPWTIAPTTPREVRHGARLAFTTVSTGDVQLLEYRTAGGVTIFTASAGEGATAAAVDFAGPIRNLCGITLSGAVFTGNPALPVAPAPPNVRTALMGDSLTTHLLDYNWSPIFWWNGLLGGRLQVVANAGVAGDRISDMLARVDNAYASGGLGDLAPLGFIQFRGGTNDARAFASISGLAANYTALLNNLGTKAERVIILSVPPIGPTETFPTEKNALTIQYNNWLAAFAAANPAKFTYVDDSANLRNPDGSQKAGYFNSDGIHNDGRATWQQGVDAAAALAPLINGYGYPSPLSTDPLDVYPAQPQWVPNHVMAGSGTTATGWGVGGFGSGFALTTERVPADVGDPNTVPWLRVIPTSVGYAGMGEALLITSALNGRAVTNADPVAWDIMVEIRFNGFDTRPFKTSRILIFSVASSQPITFDLDLKMGGESSITHGSVVQRFKMPRKTFNNEPSGISLRWEWLTRFAYSGAMGSFDFRCMTVRG